MAQFKLEIALPDRPGSLGAVASAIGFAGGDIRGLQVLKSESGRGYDEIIVAIPHDEYCQNCHCAVQFALLHGWA